MEEFTPTGSSAPEEYHPEDEYAPIESAEAAAPTEKITPAEDAASGEETAPAKEAASEEEPAPEQAQEPEQAASPASRPEAAQPPRAANPQAPNAPYPMYPQAVYPYYYVQMPYQVPGQSPYQMPMQSPYQTPVQTPDAAPNQSYLTPMQAYYPQPQGYYPQSQPGNVQSQPPMRSAAPAAQPQSGVAAGAHNPYSAPPVDREPPKEKKPPTSTGTKVFIIVLIALLVALIIGFSVYIAHLADKDKGAPDPFSSGYGMPDNNGQDAPGNPGSPNSPTEPTAPSAPPEPTAPAAPNNPGGNSGGGYPGGYPGGGSGGYPGGNPGSQGQSYDSYEEITREITLVEDKGETQKRDDDNPDTVGQPDSKAKEIQLNALPKDKSSSKYTTQTAYDSVSESVVTVELYQDKISDNTSDLKGSGTGTIITADGYIVTNAHVVGNSRRYAVKITLNSGKTYQAKVVGYDTWTDLAVLKIDAKGLKPVTFGDPDLIEIGQDVIAVGSPGGEKFKNSLTKGIVSAVDRELSINKYVKYIQSDAAISPGNSGGPLCNIYGQVIGINTAKTTATNYEAMTFSIPSDTVKEIVSDLMRYGYVRGRARIGFSGSEISTEEQYYYGYPAGIVISDIDSKGAFAGVDIKEGDIVTSLDGEEVTSFQDIYAVLNQHKSGDKIKITLSRAKQS